MKTIPTYHPSASLPDPAVMDAFFSYPWDFTAWLRRSAAEAATAGQASARRITLMFTDGSRVADALAAALSRVSVVLLLVQQPDARPVSARQQRRLKSQRIGFFSGATRSEREVRDVFDRAVTLLWHPVAGRQCSGSRYEAGRTHVDA